MTPSCRISPSAPKTTHDSATLPSATRCSDVVLAYSGVKTAPFCGSISIASSFPQLSATLPSAMQCITVAVNVIVLPRVQDSDCSQPPKHRHAHDVCWVLEIVERCPSPFVERSSASTARERAVAQRSAPPTPIARIATAVRTRRRPSCPWSPISATLADGPWSEA